MNLKELYYEPNSNRYCPHCGGRIQVGQAHVCGPIKINDKQRTN